jgi:hypothetical protein
MNKKVIKKPSVASVVRKSIAKAKRDRAAMTPQQKAAMTRTINKLEREMEAEEKAKAEIMEKGGKWRVSLKLLVIS